MELQEPDSAAGEGTATPAYFVVNKGPTKTGKNRTFHQSAVISTALRGVVKASKKKKTTTAAPSSFSLSVV